ncbi:MAG: hypothetical protein PUC44_06715 [Eubacteriales bacterium]|nr:hypothetical protein [Eubacteriales bacterium]
MADRIERLAEKLTECVRRLGYPSEFGTVLAESLGTESTLLRMIRYLRSAKPNSEEEIADEMLAICAERDAWMERKMSEYYNHKYSEYLRFGRESGPDSDDMDSEGSESEDRDSEA